MNEWPNTGFCRCAQCTREHEHASMREHVSPRDERPIAPSDSQRVVAAIEDES